MRGETNAISLSSCHHSGANGVRCVKYQLPPSFKPPLWCVLGRGGEGAEGGGSREILPVPVVGETHDLHLVSCMPTEEANFEGPAGFRIVTKGQERGLMGT